MHSMIQSMVHAFCDTSVFPVIETTFPYLVDTRKATGGGAVSSVQFHTFEQDLKTRIRIEDFDFQPIPGIVGKLKVFLTRVIHFSPFPLSPSLFS